MNETRAEPPKLGALPRFIDLLIAFLLWPLALPLVALLPAGRAGHQVRQGRGGRPFNLMTWAPRRTFWGRAGWRLGTQRLTWLVHVTRGDLSWVGPRALAAEEEVPDAEWAALRQAVRPGVFTLWRLRQLTSIDYGTEWDAEREMLALPGTKARLGMLVRCALASLYGRKDTAAADAPVLVDTVRVSTLSMDEALARIEGHLDNATANAMQVSFVNPDCVNIARRNARYRNTVNRSDLVLADGIGMRIAGKLLHRPFKQNVNGTDLFPRLCERLAARSGSLFLLGAQPGVAAEVGQWVAKHHPGVRLVGTRDGYFTAEEKEAVLAQLRAAQPDVLLVAMGAPLQECWIADHLPQTNARIAMGVGGLFDFYAGRMARAPQWLRELGLEWAYRLLKEPRRMWRRYLVGNFSFLLAVSMQRLLGNVDDWVFESDDGTTSASQATREGVLLALTDLAAPVWHDASLQPALVPLGGRPLVLRAIETLAAAGCKRIDLLANEGLTELADLVGDGTRWGIVVRLHSVGGRRQALERVRALQFGAEFPVWLGRADRWLPVHSLQAATDEVAWIHHREGVAEWTGWARLDASRLASALSDLLSGNTTQDDGLALVGAMEPYAFDEPMALLRAQARWLGDNPDRFDRLPERAPGIHAAVNARIASDARLIAPVDIGAGVVVASGAVVGPNVTLGRGALIEQGAEVAHALVAADTYVAPDAHVVEALVWPTGVLSARWAQWLPAELTQGAAGPITRSEPDRVGWSERGLALALWLALGLPALLGRLAGSRSRLVRHLVPGLLTVVAGRLPLVGVSKVSEVPATVELAGWANALRAAPVGLVTPALALSASLDGSEAQAWADVHWLHHRGWAERWRLLIAYGRQWHRPAWD